MSPRTAIDIGSNTLRMLVADEAQGVKPPWRRIAYAHRITRLAQGLHHRGRLSEEGMARTLAGLKDFAAILHLHQLRPEDAYAVATAAVRDAENGPQFLARVRAETGFSPVVISGEQEAKLSLSGALAVLDEPYATDCLLMDIGGGSTEFVLSRNGRLIEAESLRLGVVRLCEAHLKSDPPAPSDYRAMLAEARLRLKPLTERWPGKPAAYLVGTAGTVTTLAAFHLGLHPYDADRVNNHVISRAEIADMRSRLMQMTHAERQALPEIEPGRADLILAGLAIIEAVMDRWGFPSLVCMDAGLLEGAWLVAAGRLAQEK